MLQTRNGPALVAWKDTLFVLGGSTGFNVPLDSIETAKIGAKIILSEWQSAGKMSIARSNFKAVTLDSYLYLLGGKGPIPTAANQTRIAPLVSVSRLLISPQGEIISETHLPNLPEARWDFGAATAQGYIYLAGGRKEINSQDGQSSIKLTASVIYAPVYSNGDLGDWQETTALDMPLAGVELVAAGGYLYAVGGESTTQKYNMVRYAQILENGSLGKWQRTSDMNDKRAFAAVLSDDEYIYAIGGDLPMDTSGYISNKSASSVEYTQIRTDHTLSKWRLTKSLPEGRDRLAGVAVSSSVTNISNGYLFIAGGDTGQSGVADTAMNATGYNFAIGRGPAINVEFAPQPTPSFPVSATNTPTPTMDIGGIYTQAAQTLQAAMTQTAQAGVTLTATDTPETVIPTATDPAPSNTPQPNPSNTPTLTIQPSETQPPAPTLTLTPQQTVVGGEQATPPPNAQTLRIVAGILGLVIITLGVVGYLFLRQKYKGQRLVIRWPGSKPPNQL